MLTYNLDKNKYIYLSLYENIKGDIENGNIKAGEKLPSKRQLADHLKISIITVQNAYSQLLSEGYILAKERSGYYACEIYHMSRNQKLTLQTIPDIEEDKYKLSLYKNTANVDKFPFSTWAKVMRQVISENYDSLLTKCNNMGVYELRFAISQYLYEERGFNVNPNNILIGSGTEYLYSIIIKLLGRDITIGIENPGYKKIKQVYKTENVKTIPIHLDSNGAVIDEHAQDAINILHISPNHQFPTGIVMPYARRREILNWASEANNRYIIEDDYDSEFGFLGKPIPCIYHLDNLGKTIYMNTFSKTISPSLRISYLVLPDDLSQKFRNEFDFITNTVSSFEQYTLAKFISDGYFERYIKKMKKYYKNMRKQIIEAITSSNLNKYITINEESAGLHFTLTFDSDKKDNEIKELALKRGLKLIFMSDFSDESVDSSTILISYSDFHYDELNEIIDILYEILA